MHILFAHQRKKNPENKKPASGRLTLRELFSGERRKEIQGIAWWGISLLLLAAFWPHAAGHNALGPAGEIIFRIGFGCFGILIYLIPLGTAIYGVLVFRHQVLENLAVKWLGLILAILALGILIELLHPQKINLSIVKSFYAWEGAKTFWNQVPKSFRWWGDITLPAGGVLADGLADILIMIFSTVGTYILCGTILILSLYFLEVEPYWFNLTRQIIQHVRASIQKIFRTSSAGFGYAAKPGPKTTSSPTVPLPASAVDSSLTLKKAQLASAAEWPKIKITSLPDRMLSPVSPTGVLAARGKKAEKPSPRSGLSNTSMAGEGAGPDSYPSEPSYLLPSLDLLEDSQPNPALSSAYFESMSHTLENALAQFGVSAKVVEVCPGPAVTRYELQPAPGVKVNRILSLEDDITLAMRAEHVRIEAPIPGKGAVGIEIPNHEKQTVRLKELLINPEIQQTESVLTFAVGKDIGGKHIFTQLDAMPHLLIAGATGSGKSACINAIISSLLYRATPREVKLLMVDPKRVELTIYNGIPHLKSPVITDSRQAALALKLLVREMEQRYRSFAELGVRDINAYNQRVSQAEPTMAAEPESSLRLMPYIVVFIDELADLMLVAAPEVENAITRLAQMARGVGIHIVLATQRPSVDVITGLIKANFPSRIAFQVSSKVDSRTILDANGADTLLGRGDMLYAPAFANKPIRVQGVFITTAEIERLVNHWKSQGQPVYDAAFNNEILKSGPSGGESEEEDELYSQAVEWVLRAKQASTSMLQRRLKVGYSRAARLLDMMEERGVVGPPEGSKPRKVLISSDTLSSFPTEPGDET